MSDPASRAKPIYVEVQDYLLDLIDGPDYGPGDRIPSERMLADRLGINRMTVRKAIDKLVDRHVLERNGTSGTRIPLVQAARPMALQSAVGITRIIRQTADVPRSRLLHFGEEPASDSLARRLSISPGTSLTMIRCLRSVNDETFCVETSYLPAARFPGLGAEDLVCGQSLTALLKSRYGVEASVCEREIGVGVASEMEARVLRLEPGAPTLLMRLVTRDAEGTPIEYRESVNHPRDVVFRSTTSSQD